MTKTRMIPISILYFTLTACASLMPASDSEKCQALMDEAWQELTRAKLTGLSSAWQITKASRFLAQARVKYETERYELCIVKAEQAKELLDQLKQ